MRIVLRTTKILVLLSTVAAAIGVIGALWFRHQVRASLALVDGKHQVAALQNIVSVERDAHGVPTIEGQSRRDLAIALGFLHAQERFFQMDLARRSAAGEVSELVGKGALSLDQHVRIHRFRTLAGAALKLLPPSQRELLDAYTEGVNAGLTQLRQKPFEYVLLRTDPVPWRSEDCALCVYAMALNLQDSTGSYDYALGALRRQLGADAANFMTPVGSSWDAALDGSVLATPPFAPSFAKRSRTVAVQWPTLRQSEASWKDAPANEFLRVGSNSFALGAQHTALNAAILAGDMHLGLQVPNVWYRARLKWPAASGEDKYHDVVGVTIPGVPLVLCGSNGAVAWNFTNAHIDTTDLVVVEYTSQIGGKYKVDGGEAESVKSYDEEIRIKGQASVKQTVEWTRWGPLVEGYNKGAPLAVEWTLHDPRAANFDLIGMETAPNLNAALAIAKRSGGPTLNILVVDSAGEIGWTICGKIPRRVGTDGRFPTLWSATGSRWDGYLDPVEYPEMRDPVSGRLWTANNRLVGGEALALLGDGRYDLGARAKQIEADLRQLDHAKPVDLLDIQLDDRSTYMQQWRHMLLATLDDARASKHDLREFREAVVNWDGHASTDSVGYFLLRAWLERFKRIVFGPMVAACRASYPQFSPEVIRFEDPLWKLALQRPSDFFEGRFKTWDDAILQAADDVLAEAKRHNGNLGQSTWGRFNRVSIDHPLGRFLPFFLRSWLAMPTTALPGDYDLPRVQSGAFGASERMVVSPGHEDQGLFEMPGGQSGNPLSPFYRADHEAWVKGTPSPLLPGPVLYRLTLTPNAILKL